MISKRKSTPSDIEGSNLNQDYENNLITEDDSVEKTETKLEALRELNDCGKRQNSASFCRNLTKQRVKKKATREKELIILLH